MDDLVGGDRRRPEFPEDAQRLRLPGGDPPREPDQRRTGHRLSAVVGLGIAFRGRRPLPRRLAPRSPRPRRAPPRPEALPRRGGLLLGGAGLLGGGLGLWRRRRPRPARPRASAWAAARSSSVISMPPAPGAGSAKTSSERPRSGSAPAGRLGGAGLRGLEGVAERHAALADALDREGDAPALLVDLEDLDPDGLARLDDLARGLDVMLGELGDVDEALDAGDDLDERAEGDDLGDLALERGAGAVGVEDRLPRVLLRLLEPERDPLAVAIDVEDLDRDRLADLQDLGRMVDVAPGDLGDVDQPVDPLEVDEGAEVDDVGDLALDDLAGLQAPEDLLADLLALVLEDGAAAEARRCCGCG